CEHGHGESRRKVARFGSRSACTAFFIEREVRGAVYFHSFERALHGLYCARRKLNAVESDSQFTVAMEFARGLCFLNFARQFSICRKKQAMVGGKNRLRQNSADRGAAHCVRGTDRGNKSSAQETVGLRRVAQTRQFILRASDFPER